MDEKPVEFHANSALEGPARPSPSPNNTRSLFKASELVIVLLLFFVAVLALQIDGFNSPMIYDSVSWIESKSDVFARQQPLAVARIMPQRPLFMLSLYLNHSIHGMDPVYFRVFSALILAATGVALMVMLNMIMLLHPSGIRSEGSAGRLVLFLIGLIFVVHPLQVFTVMYIWQRETVLACLFYFSAVAAYAAGRNGVLRSPVTAYSLTALLFFLGLLSKENLITLPVTVVLLEFVFFPKPFRGLVKRAVATGGIALVPFLIYLLLAHHLHGPASTSSAAFQRLHHYIQESGISWLSVILTESRVWFLYLVSVGLPSVSELQLVRAMEISASLFDPPVTALACLGAVGIAVLGFAVRNREPLISFGLLFFCITLLPESLLIPQYLFFGYRPILPIAGLMLVLARILIGIETWGRSKLSSTGIKAVVGVSMCAAAAYLAITTHFIASRWNPLWIWEHSFNALPKYSSLVEISPYLDVLVNYGIALTKSGDYRAAVEVLQQAAEIPTAAGNRKKTRILVNLGNALIMTGNREEAMERFSQAIQASPRWAPPYNNLGSLLLEAGDVPSALKNFRTAVNLDPSVPLYRYSLGTALMIMGENELAAQSLLKALELKPDYPQASAKLGKTLLNLDRCQEAIGHLKTAASAFPHFADIHISLAQAYEKLGMIQEAAQHLKRVLEIEPSHQEARGKLKLLLPEPSKERSSGQ